MAATDLETFEPLILPRARRVPHALLDQAIRNVLREFCQWTRAWQYVPTAQTISDATASYTLQLPGSYAEPVAVEWASVDGSPSIPKPVEWLDEHIPTWRTRVADDFSYFTQLTPQTMVFAAVPDNAGTSGGFRYRLSLKPTIGATQTDDSMFNDWGEVVADGVVAKLLGMEGETWTNLAAAKTAANEYRIGKTKARIRAQKSFANADQNWGAKYTFAGR